MSLAHTIGALRDLTAVITRPALGLPLLAAALFIPLFINRGGAGLDFFGWMTVCVLTMNLLAAACEPDAFIEARDDLRDNLHRKTLLGLLAAVGLYLVFLIGDIVAGALFGFAQSGIENVYDFRQGASVIRVFLLMTFIIGPGEELFWRGWLQRAWARRLGPWPGFLAATALYTAVHIASGNTMLILAALVAGLFWGWLYLRFRSIWLNIVSHTAWDILVFLIIPFH